MAKSDNNMMSMGLLICVVKVGLNYDNIVSEVVWAKQ